MKYILLILMLSFQCLANNTHHIFLAPQAETEHKMINPALSQCGRLRAKQLSTLLSYSNITHIYSSADRSTMETAHPLANKNELPIKVFSDKLIDSLAITLINEPKNVLIIANQEVIEFLVEFISNESININTKDRHNILYQISIVDDKKVFSILKQPLEC